MIIKLEPFKVKTWNIEEMTGYKPLTTCYEDFGIAEHFGIEAVKDTYQTMFESLKNSYVMLTELVMVLNWKSFEHCETNEALCSLYVELYEKTDNYCCDNLKGEELTYYYTTTD